MDTKGKGASLQRLGLSKIGHAGHVLDSDNYYSSSPGRAGPLAGAGRPRPAAGSGTKAPIRQPYQLESRTFLLGCDSVNRALTILDKCIESWLIVRQDNGYGYSDERTRRGKPIL